MKRLVLILPLTACVGVGEPVVRQVEGGVPQFNSFEAAGGPLTDVTMVDGLVVSGASDATGARRAIHAFCGNTTPFDPMADSDPIQRDPDTGEYMMPGTC